MHKRNVRSIQLLNTRPIGV